jgi:hypothetical protein
MADDVCLYTKEILRGGCREGRRDGGKTESEKSQSLMIASSAKDFQCNQTSLKHQVAGVSSLHT